MLIEGTKTAPFAVKAGDAFCFARQSEPIWEYAFAALICLAFRPLP